MDYNIHLHLPGGQDVSGQSAQTSPIAEAPKNRLGSWYGSFVRRIGKCYNWRSLYELAEDFHKIGMTIRDTNDGKRILCRLEGGKPITDNIIDDYIYIGSKMAIDEEVSERAMEVITHFVEENANEPQKVVTDEQDYSRNVSLYGDLLQYNDSPTAKLGPKFVELKGSQPTCAQEIELISRLL